MDPEVLPGSGEDYCKVLVEERIHLLSAGEESRRGDIAGVQEE